jgi:hypothetical protein
LGKRKVSQTPSKKERGNQEASGVPTPMESAFLAGLIDLARRETSAESIALPTGAVKPHELRQAVVALMRAKGEVAP